MNEKEVAVQKDFLHGREPIVLFLDEEVSEAFGSFYDAYKGPIRRIVQPQMVISFAWQFQGERTIHVRALPDYKEYRPGWDNLDDKEICKDMYDIVSRADLIVGHNAKEFDLKIAKSRFLAHGFWPLKKIHVEDTLKMLWKYFRLPQNTLDYACQYVGLPGKGKQRHSDFLDGCYDGNMKDWRGMKKYNRRDIEITKAFYEKISPWHENHFNLNLIKRGGNLCRVCVANGRLGNNVIANGYQERQTFSRQQYLCHTCGHQWLGERIARIPRQNPPDKELEVVNQFNQ